jgi:hypothetical protein
MGKKTLTFFWVLPKFGVMGLCVQFYFMVYVFYKNLDNEVFSSYFS